MVNYQNGSIYAIKSNIGDKIYIGSTTKKYLSARMAEHRNDYREWKIGGPKQFMACELFDEYGVENCYIDYIELFPCNNRYELRMREYHFIRSLACVNKKCGITMPQERDKREVEYQSKYRKENKEDIRRKDRVRGAWRRVSREFMAILYED